MLAKLTISVLNRFSRDEEGAAMVEYGLLVALIALVVAAALTLVGTGLSAYFSDIKDYITSHPVPS